jgi:hypothetical protein
MADRGIYEFNRPMREVKRRQISLHQDAPSHVERLNRKYSYTEAHQKQIVRSK